MHNPKVLFVYYMEPEIQRVWKDGLWAALNILKKDFDITYLNLFEEYPEYYGGYDFILAWGGWRSPADNFIHRVRMIDKKVPTGLCIGGNAIPPFMMDDHSILFYETEWYKEQISSHKNIKHAFGVNRNIHCKLEKADFGRFTSSTSGENGYFLWNFTSVGSFSKWKHHEKLLEKTGNRLAIGQIQKNNLGESLDIIGPLLLDGVAISDMVSAEDLNVIYNLTETVYIPADINGGGERAVLEARSAGAKVLVDNSNVKLLSLLQGPIWGEQYYADQLKEGILSCLSDI